MKNSIQNSPGIKFTILFLCFFICNATKAQPGFLDQSFGDGGKVLIYAFGSAEAIAIQNDSKILMGGAGTFNGDTGHLIIRLLPDGSIDQSFGVEGSAVLDWSQFPLGGITDLKVQNDEKIMSVSDLGGSIMLARFKENGTLDSSFGTDGTTRSVFEHRTIMYEMQIQPDGKYVLAGNNTDANFNQDIVVSRFNPGGSRDESFGDSGEVIISLHYAMFAKAVILQPDGKIIIGGSSDVSKNKFFIARLNADGSLDNSFGPDGTVQSDIGNGEEYINSLALQPDGKILAAGPGNITNNGLEETMAVARYNTDGSLDKSFGKNGVATAKFENNGAEAKTVLLQEDGKIILTGTTLNKFTDYVDAALARLKPDGTLDSSFGVNGMQTTTGGGGDIENDAVLQPDNKIVLTGESYINGYYYSAFRYNNDAVMPLHFTYFNAAPTNNGGIALNWQTAQENNNNYFSVERSSNNNFTEIARVPAKSHQQIANSYSYTDNAPLQATNFYRLKQVDKDGKFSYSQIVSATLQNGLTVVLYPNPIKDVLNIKGLDAGMSYELSVMSTKGNIAAQTSINNTSSYNWNLHSLSKGVYYLSVISGDKKTMIRFVKE